MIIIAQDKKELANLLASVKNSVVKLNPEMDSQKLLLICRNLSQIADICKC